MANIKRSALQLLTDLSNAGTDPARYLDAIEPERLLKNTKDVDYSEYRRADEYADMLGHQDVSDPALRRMLLDYSGSGSYEYSKPYRMTRSKIIEEQLRRQSQLEELLQSYQKSFDSPYVSSYDKPYYASEIEKIKKQLAEPPKLGGYGKDAAKMLQTFYPAPNDFVTYRGLNPRSNTADRLHEIENRLLQIQEGFGEANDYVPPQKPTDWGNRGFLSTSMYPAISKSFGDGSATEGATIGYSDKPSSRLFKILVPEGTPIRPLLNKISENPNEAEVLLPPMSVYEQLGDKDEYGFMPLMWVGRGKPTSERYIGGALPFLAGADYGQDDADAK